jgi:caa(3)-type oxidase subunit IV
MATGTHTAEVATGIAKAVEQVKRPYFAVFLVLAVVTVFEIQVPALGSYGVPKEAQIIMLMATAVAKASFVALYYMHLKYEPLVLRYLPLIPLGLVAILILTLVA